MGFVARQKSKIFLSGKGIWYLYSLLEHCNVPYAYTALHVLQRGSSLAGVTSLKSDLEALAPEAEQAEGLVAKAGGSPAQLQDEGQQAKEEQLVVNRLVAGSTTAASWRHHQQHLQPAHIQQSAQQAHPVDYYS